jgi:hypothetical protein
MAILAVKAVFIMVVSIPEATPLSWASIQIVNNINYIFNTKLCLET